LGLCQVAKQVGRREDAARKESDRLSTQGLHGQKLAERGERGRVEMPSGVVRGTSAVVVDAKGGWVPVLLTRAADRQPIDAQRRLADSDGHALAFLAADADAFIELEIVTDHAHAREYVGPVAH